LSGADFLRLAKLTGGGIVRRAARHNRRVIQAELGASGSIDPTRTHLNETLTGPPTADDVATLARDLMREAGIDKTRKNAVLALEIIFSLAPNHGLDERAYFTDCVRWAGDKFSGAQNILSADIHRDEAAPHCHVLILPLVAGRMVGSDLVGSRKTLRDTRQNFHSTVGSRYGLAKAPPRPVGATKAAAAAKVLEKLRTGLDGALKSVIWPQLRSNIEQDPGPYMVALGIDVDRPSKRMKTMEEIFISPGRGPKVERKPIGFTAPPSARSLCSVGFAPQDSAAPAPMCAPPPAPAPLRARAKRQEQAESIDHAQDLRREREDCFDAGLYDPQTGEFIKAPTKDGHPEDWPPPTSDSGESPHWAD